MNNDTEQIFLLNPSDNQSTAESQKNIESTSNQVNLENVEDFTNVCRTCASITDFVIPIFMGEGLQNNLADKIHKHLPIQVSEEDLLPQVVCYQCASTLLAWHELVQCCVQADAALKTRLAVILAKDENTNNENHDDKNLEIETKGKFKNVDFVQSGPHLIDSNKSKDSNKSCEYCGLKQPVDIYAQHLVAVHSELLFHCNECDTYLDKKDFILHMSMHAIRYVSHDDKQPEKRSKKYRKSRSSRDRNEKPMGIHKQKSLKVKETTEKNKDNPKDDGNEVIQENEFSDHSDVEYFGRLPESVFEAIEDTQDSRHDDNDMCLSPQNDTPSENNENTDECKESNSPITSETLHKTGKNKKPRTCPICSKVYTASSSYFYHLKNSHQQTKPYECDVCGKKFVNKNTLAQHSSVHDMERRLQCRQCPKRFRSKASLYIHEQSHSGVKSWVCSQCNRSFRWRTHLQRHARRHEAQKTHLCGTCGRGFSVHCDLLRHTRTHTAGSFACNKCDLKFAQPRYLKVHMRNKHLVISGESNS
ncbi:zinc finger protein 471-like isoform X1 [Battus philenor]|uniref:zinc finger protein 471-like isoform X1 n=1 Tax=Battus philenor TaxID=42288 RepID=UPI0035D13598